MSAATFSPITVILPSYRTKWLHLGERGGGQKLVLCVQAGKANRWEEFIGQGNVWKGKKKPEHTDGVQVGDR